MQQVTAVTDDERTEAQALIVDCHAKLERLRDILGISCGKGKPKAKRKPYVPNPEALCKVCGYRRDHHDRDILPESIAPHAFVLLRGKRVTA